MTLETCLGFLYMINQGYTALWITIPSNTTATVWIPALEGWNLTESGNPIEEAEGITFIRNEPGFEVYDIGSGSYEFITSE